MKATLLAASLSLSACASAPEVIAPCPALPVPPPQLTAPVPPKNYLCELARVLDQPKLCNPLATSDRT